MKYKVIANYPYSTFEIGDIVEFDGVVFGMNEPQKFIRNPEDYPLIFELLHNQMEKPNKEKYGWHNQDSFDDLPSGWMIEGGEEAYFDAVKKWQFMQDKRYD